MILLAEKELEQLDYSYPRKFKSSHEIDMWVKHVVAKAQLEKALIGVGKETKRIDGTTYLVPDYHKYREALKEVEQ